MKKENIDGNSLITSIMTEATTTIESFLTPSIKSFLPTCRKVRIFPQTGRGVRPHYIQGAYRHCRLNPRK